MAGDLVRKTRLSLKIQKTLVLKFEFLGSPWPEKDFVSITGPHLILKKVEWNILYVLVIPGAHSFQGKFLSAMSHRCSEVHSRHGQVCLEPISLEEKRAAVRLNCGQAWIRSATAQKHKLNSTQHNRLLLIPWETFLSCLIASFGCCPVIVLNSAFISTPLYVLTEQITGALLRVKETFRINVKLRF